MAIILRVAIEAYCSIFKIILDLYIDVFTVLVKLQDEKKNYISHNPLSTVHAPQSISCWINCWLDLAVET